MIMKRLTDRLDLNPAQRDQVEAIVDRFQKRMRRQFQVQHRERRKFIEEGFLEIRALLRADQMKKLDVLKAEMDERHKNRQRRWFGNHRLNPPLTPPPLPE